MWKNFNQNKIYIAHLYDIENRSIGEYIIYGDQWRLDANFIKMKYLQSISGIEPKYSLNRFEGRYMNVYDQNKLKKFSYQIEPNNMLNTFSGYFDIKYGTSVYKDIEIDTIFKIFYNSNGLIVRTIENNKENNNESFITKTKIFLDSF